jgi:hypothetical protein
MRVSPLMVVSVAVLLTASSAYATGYRVGFASQQEGPTRASVGASVHVSSSVPGAPGGSETGSGPSEQLGGGEPSSSAPEAESTCVREPKRIPCAPQPETPEQPAKVRPAINPETVAVTVANRLSLGVGKIAASPSARDTGLTGAASWFWLEPAPAAQSQTLALHGEQVTVSATVASVQWVFGDGSQVTGGPGEPYRPGAVPAGAVTHVYETRCLPGDQGHDPSVTANCGAKGYEVRAVVEWAISYRATGPVTTTGSLPPRSTEATIAYPVSEARAFLTGGGQ